MSIKHARVLSPRNGHTLVVGIVARISGCANQKEMSLDDQVDHAKAIVAEMYDGPVDYRLITSKAKGERIDRPELDQIKAMLRTCELDLLMAEDLGRIIRGADAVPLCGLAVDKGTRVLTPNDYIDTNDESWEEDVISACRDHVGHNSHTSKRLKHKLMNRFVKFGGVMACRIFGYIKPLGVKTYHEWQKDPAATPIYQEWFLRLKETGNCSAVADWLNNKQIPVGPYSRRKNWSGAMVRRITSNPILKGLPGRGFRHTIKNHESGRRVSVKNPDGAQFRDCPHLAHVDPLLWEEVNALLNARNCRFHRKAINGIDPLYRVPRKRTRFPGQHARCWYCGHQFVWGGNGVTENLMCSGAREWHCWNSMGFSGEVAARRLVEAITAELYALEGFGTQFSELVQAASQNRSSPSAERWQKLQHGEEVLAQAKDHVTDAITEYGPRPMFEQKLAELDTKERELARERLALESVTNRPLRLSGSVVELRQMLEDQFAKLAIGSPEFGQLMAKLVPEFHVYLVRLCDGGHLLPRARIKLALDGIMPDAQQVPGLSPILTRYLTLQLFDPPQREQIRERAVIMTAQGMGQREIASQLEVTQPAVQRALDLEQKMKDSGLDTPYILVSEPPADYGKLRRHKNAKHQFMPLEGYQRPSL